MNTGWARRQQPAPQSVLATAPLTLEQWPAAMGDDYDLTGLLDLGSTAALARQVSPDRHAAPCRVHRECCLSKARS